jgi:hypothetical protein
MLRFHMRFRHMKWTIRLMKKAYRQAGARRRFR